MSRPTGARFRGRVRVRPWRVGLLVDLDDELAVRGAVAALTDVWGGVYLPILDRKSPIENLRSAANIFDLDCLFATESEGELSEFLQEPGYRWRGRGPFGPFSSDGGIRKGILRAQSLSPTEEDVPWSGPDSDDLIVSAYLGHSNSAEPRSRPIGATGRHLRLATSYANHAPRGLCVVREATPRDIAWFWNCRSLSGQVYPLATSWADFNSAVLRDVEEADLPQHPRPDPAPQSERDLYVWGFDDLATIEQDRLETWASRLEVQIIARERRSAIPGAWFPGFEEVASATFRIDAGNSERVIHVPSPSLPLVHNDIYQGVVAAEVSFHEASGLDPRLSVAIPAYRSHSALLESNLTHEAEQVRVSRVGPVLGMQTHADEVPVPMAYNLDIMALLFDSSWSIAQSDEGQFQTRAAEMFGGTESHALAQPGLRAAIQCVAKRASGVTWDQLWQVTTNNRGDWPNPVWEPSTTPRDYGVRQAQYLVNSGLLVPTMEVECSHCRVVSHVAPKDLDVKVQCEFCGEESRLALSLTLTKPTWRYRFAAHLTPEKVYAFLPAMAATSVLTGFRHVEGPPPSHIFGLKVRPPNAEPIEVDIATILREDRWTVVLGEVKNRNRIDANDIDNLLLLQRTLRDRDIPCVVLIATLKDCFSDDEKEHLRSAIEREKLVAHTQYQTLPLLPLLLTHHDMSRSTMDKGHPWHWSTPGQGILSIAIQSCKQNLGLLSVDFEAPNTPVFKWESPVSGT